MAIAGDWTEFCVNSKMLLHLYKIKKTLIIILFSITIKVD